MKQKKKVGGEKWGQRDPKMCLPVGSAVAPSSPLPLCVPLVTQLNFYSPQRSDPDIPGSIWKGRGHLPEEMVYSEGREWGTGWDRVEGGLTAALGS